MKLASRLKNLRIPINSNITISNHDFLDLPKIIDKKQLNVEFTLEIISQTKILFIEDYLLVDNHNKLLIINL